MNLIHPILPITLTRLFPRRLRDFFSFLQKVGSEEVTDEDLKRRIILVNTISLTICGMLITIAPPVCYALGDNMNVVLIPVIFDFLFTLSALFLNYRKRYLRASLAIFMTQCISIMYFGILLSAVVALDAMIIFLLSIIYLIFKEEKIRRIAVVTAVGAYAIMEICYYYGVVKPLEFDHTTTVVLHVAIITGILALVLIVSKKSNEITLLLKRANHFKKLFVHQVTHEIRTPLNAIYGVAQLLKREIKLDPNLKGIEALVDSQLDAINNTRNIINNVLDMAQIESGFTEKTEKEHFLLKPLFTKILDVNRVIARTRNIRLKLDIDQMPEAIYDDVLKIYQISTNLLNNAIKYADKNTIVILKITGAGDQWMLEVTNNGPMITPEKQELIFNPFVTDKSKYIEGTGLGLYIVKGKVASMNGAIKLVSTEEGTTFTVTLPLIKGDASYVKADTEDGDYMDHLGNIRVLMAEDNELNATLLLRLLNQVGCQVIWVKNGQELIREVEKHVPDIIIMDYHMEVMDGEETLRYLKKNTAYKDIPVIISTGDAYAETRDTFIKAGADAFIEKPINYSSLIKVLKMHLHHNSEELQE